MIRNNSVSRALKRHHAKHGASAEAEVRETLNANAERERNFAKCWGCGGKYFAKFASRVFEFFGEWAPKTKNYFVKRVFF
jgi:hypothetical protein